MRALLAVGLLLVLLGIASLFIAVPRRERHGLEAGPVSVGVVTTRRETVHPAISAVLIGGGALLMFASRRKK